MKYFKGIQFKSFWSRRRFGVELELTNNVSKPRIRSIITSCSGEKVHCTGHGCSVNNDYWHIKPDATCGRMGRFYDRGWEVASPVCSGFSQALYIGKVTSKLRSKGLAANRNCGFHVHVEIKDLWPQDVGRILAHWLKAEPYILASLPLFRKKDFCLPLYTVLDESSYRNKWKDKLKEPIDFWNFFKPNLKCCTNVYDSEYRYRAVNIVNYAAYFNWLWTRPTIEFRVAEGTVKAKDVVNWIRLYVNFIETAIDKPVPNFNSKPTLTDALCSLGLHHDEDFHILSKGLQKTKTWFLERLFRYTNCQEAKEILNDMWNPVKHY